MGKPLRWVVLVLAWLAGAVYAGSQRADAAAAGPSGAEASRAASKPKAAAWPLWDLARQKQGVHRFSTLITAQQVRDHLGTAEGTEAAIRWCRQTGVTKVYIESFRDGYQASAATLEAARDRFRQEGFEVSGCVTTTRVGKPSTGWRGIACYTDRATQERLAEIFAFTAARFDEIMIDDFWFTDCTCPACDAARKVKAVTVLGRSFAVPGDSWEAYRCELIVQLSREAILAPARRANPKVQVIIKYPQWYDRFHERGYEVVRETADFDRIWVGTETRDYHDRRWGGTVQYEGYFIMRWLGGIGGAKCGGGWYDPYGTTAKTYVEQARQTILGGARESLLFCYGSLLRDTGPANVEALRACMPELFDVADQVAKRTVVGVAAYKPPSSAPGREERVFDFVGMMGLPLVPCHEFPEKTPAAFFSFHALKDADFPAKLSRLLDRGVPVLVTDGLAKALAGRVALDRPQVRVLAVRGRPAGLLELPQADLDSLRGWMLKALGRRFEAPNRVSLYLFADGSWVIENFRDEPAAVKLDGEALAVPARGWVFRWK